MITEQELEVRIEFWLEELWTLGIGHWRIKDVEIVDEVDGQPDGKAGVWTSDYYDSCSFQFCRDDLPEGINREVDETIVHELLHVAWRDLAQASKIPSGSMSRDVAWELESRVEHETEGIIERLARLIVEKVVHYDSVQEIAPGTASENGNSEWTSYSFPTNGPWGPELRGFPGGDQSSGRPDHTT
jgi:hypothetical protein